MKFFLFLALALAALVPAPAQAATKEGVSPEMGAYVEQMVRRALQFNASRSNTFLDAKADFTQVGWYLFTEMLRSGRLIDYQDIPVADMNFTPTGAAAIEPMDKMDLGLRIPGQINQRLGGGDQAYIAIIYVGLVIDKNAPPTMPAYLIQKLSIVRP